MKVWLVSKSKRSEDRGGKGQGEEMVRLDDMQTWQEKSVLYCNDGGYVAGGADKEGVGYDVAKLRIKTENPWDD